MTFLDFGEPSPTVDAVFDFFYSNLGARFRKLSKNCATLSNKLFNPSVTDDLSRFFSLSLRPPVLLLSLLGWSVHFHFFCPNTEKSESCGTIWNLIVQYRKKTITSKLIVFFLHSSKFRRDLHFQIGEFNFLKICNKKRPPYTASVKKMH